MSDLVYDVSYTQHGHTLTARGRTPQEAVALWIRFPHAAIAERKLLPCAQRRVADARIATLPPAGTTPANPAGGGDL